MAENMDVLEQQPAPVDLDAWCRTVDRLVADGVDPFTACVDADREHQRALQLSLDRD